MTSRSARRWGVVGVAVVMCVAVLGPVALAGHMNGWTHDHSSSGVPYRPDGYNDLVRVFGQPCNSRADDARVWLPHVTGRHKGAYQYFHPRLSRNVSHNILGHVSAAHRTGAWDYGQYGFLCRQMSGSSSWSTHAFGAAFDTNTLRNPQGNCSWDGRGVDGVAYGSYIPDVWRNAAPGHMFRWGKSWCDPHHFQYVTSY